MFKGLFVYMAVWAITIATFWFFNFNDAMGFSLVYLWGILPITSFVCSIEIGMDERKYKWAMCIVLGVMYMLAEYFTFSLANNIEFNKLNSPEWMLMIIGTSVSAFGITIGELTRRSNV